MTKREAELRGMGVAFNPGSGEFGAATRSLETLSDSTFSGYGEYTPITVRSYSMPGNADLERNKQRD